MVAGFLSRYKHALNWLHIATVLATLWLVIPWLAWRGDEWLSPSRFLFVLALATLAWSQNIGLIHHCDHFLPAGPRQLGRVTAVLLHAMGGLPYTQTRFAHSLHHAHLGTDLDPDRAGYQTTTSTLARLRYLFLIGPLRSRLAPVDLGPALARLSASRRLRYDTACRREQWLRLVVHFALALVTGAYYLAVFAGLLLANVFGNAREMAEHGNGGQAAYVDIKVSPVGVLLFSTPGFWFHGVHHTDAGIHYLDLPLAEATIVARTDLAYLKRRSALAYVFTGR